MSCLVTNRFWEWSRFGEFCVKEKPLSEVKQNDPIKRIRVNKLNIFLAVFKNLGQMYDLFVTKNPFLIILTAKSRLKFYHRNRFCGVQSENLLIKTNDVQ